MMQFIQAHPGELFGLLFAISELMALNPKIKSNGVFDMAYSYFKSHKKPD
jgi:hypothetical protein